MLGTYALSAGYYDAYYGKALKVRRLITDDFARAYQHADVLLTPASPSVAFKFGAKTDNPLAMYLCDTYTIPSNLSGDPGMSVPFGTGADGLPVGVQVLAPALGEPVMFQVAAELGDEQWRARTVPVHRSVDRDRDRDVPGHRIRARRRARGPRRAGDRHEAVLGHRRTASATSRTRTSTPSRSACPGPCRCSTGRPSSWRCGSASR